MNFAGSIAWFGKLPISSPGQFLVGAVTVTLDNACRRPRNRAIRRHVAHHDEAVGANLNVVPDRDRTKQDGARSDKHVIAQRGMSFTLVFAGTAERDVVKKHAVSADDSRFANHHTHSVVDKKTWADPRARMNLQSRQKAIDLRKQARDKRDSQLPKQMDEPVKCNRMEPRIQQELNIPAGRIVSIGRLNVFKYRRHDLKLFSSFSIYSSPENNGVET